jgi:hypothetical protein
LVVGNLRDDEEGCMSEVAADSRRQSVGGLTGNGDDF